MPYVRAKGWLASKTVWLGLAATVLGIVELLRADPLLIERYPEVIGALGVLVIVLRALTTQPLSSHPVEDGGRGVDAAPPKA